jgi:hypothetical protein
MRRATAMTIAQLKPALSASRSRQRCCCERIEISAEWHDLGEATPAVAEVHPES